MVMSAHYLSRAKGCTCTVCARSKIIVARGNVNSLVTEFAYRFGLYRETSSGYHGKLSPQHIGRISFEFEFKDRQYSRVLCAI